MSATPETQAPVDAQPQSEDAKRERGHKQHSDKPSDKPNGLALPREIGGRDGPEPTRFGDWEKSGRCIDF